MVVREFFGHEDGKFTVMLLPGMIPLHTVGGNSDVQSGYACEAMGSVIRVIISIRACIILSIHTPIYTHLMHMESGMLMHSRSRIQLYNSNTPLLAVRTCLGHMCS